MSGVGTLSTNWTNGVRDRNPRRRNAETREASIVHGVDPNSFFGKKGHAIFDGEINDLKSLDEALELGVVKERGKGLVAL
jgi:hypothetical protein